MRYLVLSDIHSRNKVIRFANRHILELDLDAVIVLGDITHFGPPSWASEFLSQLEKRAYAIPGNCDPPGTLEEIERSAISLHRNRVEVGGWTIGGHGGSNITIFNTPNELTEEELEKGLRPIMQEGMVLVVHCPPYGILDMTSVNRHAGSTAVARMIEEFSPRVVLSGHIHEARGILQQDGILYMNPGAAKDGYAGVLELEDEPKAILLEKAGEE
ncbi:MAG: metallophosphoesterase family protein [Methanomassiliicoccales archaeon]